MACRDYKKRLVNLFEFLDDQQYSLETVFPEHKLLSLKPEDIARFLNKLAYNKMNPGEEDHPTFCRANTLLAAKRQISSFMPRKSQSWDPILRIGNPTRSREVSEVIRKVKKAEARGIGLPSNRKRALLMEELLNMLHVVRRVPQITGTKSFEGYRYAALYCLQWSLIGRIDDLMKLERADFEENLDHKFALLIRVKWSKNIVEERQAPPQIILGSMDENMCPLLAFVVYIESFSIRNLNELRSSRQVFCRPKAGHVHARAVLKKILASNLFSKKKEGDIGTHSLRRGPATYASKQGLSRDLINSRGRWRDGASKTVNLYIDLHLPVQDAEVAASLSGPAGPCKYRLAPNCEAITKDFILKKLCRSTALLYGNEVALTLSLPLMWAAFSKTNLLPEELRKRVRNMLQAEGRNDDSNPVEKVRIQPVGKAGNLGFVEVQGLDTDSGLVQDGNHSSFQQNLLQHLTTQNSLLQQTNGIVTELHKLKSEVKKDLAIVNRNLKRLSRKPFLRNVRPRNADEDVRGVEEETHESCATSNSTRVAKLSRVKTLHQLWDEYTKGINGCIPAKDFFPHEVRAQKSSFSRRKTFWKMVQNMLRKGYSSDTAIDRIYQIYGNSTTITNILIRIREDYQKKRLHPDLTFD